MWFPFLISSLNTGNTREHAGRSLMVLQKTHVWQFEAIVQKKNQEADSMNMQTKVKDKNLNISMQATTLSAIGNTNMLLA